MGLPSEMRDHWAPTVGHTSSMKIDNHNNSCNNYDYNNRYNTSRFVIPSPVEDQKILEARRCTQEGVRAGAKAAAVAAVASAVPTLVAVRVIPWAKANLNYTAQALIISAASISAYFITADKTILECARRNAQYDKTT